MKNKRRINHRGSDWQQWHLIGSQFDDFMIAAYLGVLTLGQNDKFQNQLSPSKPGKSWKKTFLHVLKALFIHPLILKSICGKTNKSLPQITRQKTPTTIRIANRFHLFGIYGVRHQRARTSSSAYSSDVNLPCFYFQTRCDTHRNLEASF